MNTFREMSVLVLLVATLSLASCGNEVPPKASAEEGAAAHHEGGEAEIHLSAEQIAAADIEMAQAGSAEIREVLPLYGAIVPNAERVLDVTARFPGVIRSVKRRVGEPVAKGETLATVESNESLQSYAVISPLAGVVTQRQANEGAQTADAPLFTVADLSTVWVELSVFPRDAPKVRVGQLVLVRSPDTDLSAQGKVVYVAPFGSSASQTLTARVQLPNKEQQWRPGLYVTAEVVLATTPVSLAVKSDALQTIDGKTVVFVRSDEGFVPRAVETGRSDGDLTEIRSGIAAGDNYATRNSFILKAELGKGEAEHEH